MSEGLHIFFVDDADVPRQVARRRYDALLERRPGECFPELAGSLVRCAVVRVEYTEGVTPEILGMHCFLLPLDREGRLDMVALEQDLKSALEKGEPLPGDAHAGRILDARDRFAKRRYDGKYHWTLTPEIRKAIEGIIAREDPVP